MEEKKIPTQEPILEETPPEKVAAEEIASEVVAPEATAPEKTTSEEATPTQGKENATPKAKETEAPKKPNKKQLIAVIAAIVAVAILIPIIILLPKTPSEIPEETTSTTPTENNNVTPTPSGKTEYTVNIKRIGGLAVPNVTFLIYEGENLVSYGQTDANGIGTVSLPASNNYKVKVSISALKGYTAEEEYSFVGTSANIVLKTSVIEDSDLTGVRYQLGDIMRDFTYTTTDGKIFQLSEVLKEKKAVLINFWYSTCGPCVNEFPYLESAYEKYKDSIEVIALNNYYSDNEATVKAFKESMALTFPVAKDYTSLGSAFNLSGYPTSILVDRYGTICLIEVGGLTSEKPFVAVFDYYSSDSYEQKLLASIDELTPTEIPNIEMPSSEEIGAALNGNGFSATYAPETESADAEYSWPFIVGAKDGITCVYPSNSYKDNSFATLHASVELKAGEVLAVDYLSETEYSVDTFFILVDGKDIIQISGSGNTDWKTCYPFVATEDGTYNVTFIYVKDGDGDEGDDRVYLKELRTVAISEMTGTTYIPRQAATKPNANGLGYQQYASVVFNANDGYYHVGSENGPLLLVNLMSGTQLREDISLNDLGYNGELVDAQGDIYLALVDYCNYSINGKLYGYSPVTEELRGLLERAAAKAGFEQGNPDQWLQTCIYYDAYGPDVKQLEDPVKGIAFFAAFDTVLSTETEEIFNTVEYDGRIIMPRGLKYKFVPEVSGVYQVKSQSKDEVYGWLFDEQGELIYTASVVDRPYDGNPIDTVNVSMIYYFEAGKTYYIDIAYYDIYAAGTFTFTVKYLASAADYKQFHLASPGYFTYLESTTGQMNQTIAGGIDVKLGDDGYYHEVLANGELGSIVYADFKFSTGLFSHSIQEAIALGGFNFAYSETDQMVMAMLKEYNGDINACREYYKNLWGDEYDEWEATYQLEEVFAGKYHGTGKDYTAAIEAYIAKMIPASADAPELEGCVAVDAELAQILQAYMDKYTFSGVTNSWTKLCYYYKTFA